MFICSRSKVSRANITVTASLPISIEATLAHNTEDLFLQLGIGAGIPICVNMCRLPCIASVLYDASRTIEVVRAIVATVAPESACARGCARNAKETRISQAQRRPRDPHTLAITTAPRDPFIDPCAAATARHREGIQEQRNGQPEHEAAVQWSGNKQTSHRAL